MSALPYVNSFRDLIIYQKSRQLARDVFEVSQQFPKEEMFSLTDQGRRSSRSIGAQVAEAWAKRKYEKHFLSKLTDADGEQQEMQHWLETAVDCRYLTKEEGDYLMKNCEEIGRLSGGMMAKSNMFCDPTRMREPDVEYFINRPSIDT